MPDLEDGDLLDALARLPTIAHPVISPDGDRVALYYDGTGRNEVHVLDPATGSLVQWSDGNVPRDARWFLRWDGAGERILFHQDEAGNEQNDIYALSNDGETEPLVEIDRQAMIAAVGEDVLLFTSTRDGQMNLFRHDYSTGEHTKLTEYDRAVAGVYLSPDGDRIAYSTNERDDFDNRDVYLADADGTNPRILEVGEVGSETGPAGWRSDGKALLIGDNSADLGRIGVYDLERDDVDWLGDQTYEESPVGFLPGDERVLGTRLRDGMTIPVVYDPNSGEGRELEVPDGVTSPGMFLSPQLTLEDGRIVLQHTSPTRRMELWAYDLETDDYEVILEADYGLFDRDQFADAAYFRVRSDGTTESPPRAVPVDPGPVYDIGAILYDSGARPSPLIVKPHGGPLGRDTLRFDLYTQVLAMRGYSVLQVNYRGSTGRGRTFEEELHDDWGGREQGDVAAVLEHTIAEHEWIDDDRIAVFGGSYGGYSAFWQLVQYPDLYDAGIGWIGVTELEDMYENTMPHYRIELMERYLGRPNENPDLYRDRSPVTHVDNIDAPVFIVHGVNDRRVPVSQARLLRDALLDAGFTEGQDEDFEYRELGEEGHASSDQDQKRRMFGLLDDFLARRL